MHLYFNSETSKNILTALLNYLSQPQIISELHKSIALNNNPNITADKIQQAIIDLPALISSTADVEFGITLTTRHPEHVAGHPTPEKPYESLN